MAELGDLIARIEQESKKVEAVAEIAKAALVEAGAAINAALRRLAGTSPVEAPTTQAPRTPSGYSKGKGKKHGNHGLHPIWHGRLSGQFIRSDGTKACANCHKFFTCEDTYFAKSSLTPTGRQSYCKRCTGNKCVNAASRRAPDITETVVLRRHSVDTSERRTL